MTIAIPRHAVSSMLKRSGRPRTAIARAGSTSTRRGWSAARGTRRFSRCSIVSDFLLLPAAQVFPFAVETCWPTEIAGRTMDSYHRWMEVVVGPTLAGAPAVSVPAGFNEAGLPMGLQIIAAPRRDADLLAVAALYEKLCPWLDRLPALIGGHAESAAVAKRFVT